MPVTPTDKTIALFSTPANRKLISELERGGANIVLFPAVEPAETELDTDAEKLLTELSQFDWIIFPDVFAAEYFLSSLEKLAVDFYELDLLRVCAFGETVADRLRFSQVHSDVISNTVETREVFQALAGYETEISNIRALIVTAEAAQPAIAAELKNSGAAVTELPVYRIETDQISGLPKLNAFLKGGAIDEFIFSSPTDALSLSILFPSEDIPNLLAGMIISATNISASQSLNERGVNQVKMR